MNDKFVAYYKDQVGFYTKRMKRAEKAIRDIQSLGLEPDQLSLRVLADEKENVERYEEKLKQALK